MLLFARVPHSSVLYTEAELKAANFSLKVCRGVSRTRGTQTVTASKLWFNY